MSLWFPAINAMMTVNDYRGRRAEGQGRLQAGFAAYVNYRIWSHFWLLAGAQAIGGITPILANAAAGRMRSVRQSVTPFAPAGRMPDSQELSVSRQALMQSSQATNGSLSLQGKSFAGSEAAVMHQRWTR